VKTTPNRLYVVKNLLKTHLLPCKLAFFRGFLPSLSDSHHVFRQYLTQRGFTLIELLVVLVIIALVWTAVLPMMQPDQQRQGRDWLNQAQAMLSLTCDLSAQTLQTHRLLWRNNQLVMQVYAQSDWLPVRDVDPLPLVAGWMVKPSLELVNSKKDEPIAWLCRPDGEQTAGNIQLSRDGLGSVSLRWQGDGRYEQR
jgi:general secretion pathway protein H